MLRSCALISLLLAVLAGGLVGGTQERAPAVGVDALEGLRGGAKVQALIELVVTRQRAVASLRANFVQLKESSLLLAPVSSSGVFSYLAPDHVRWDYQAPDEMIVVFDDDTITTYHPERASAERLRIPRRHRKLVQALAGTQPLDELAAQFSVTLSDPGPPGPFRLELRPTHAALEARLEAVHIEIDRTLLLPVMVEYRERDGDGTRYEFHDLELNPGLVASDFRLELAEGVEIQTLDAS